MKSPKAYRVLSRDYIRKLASLLSNREKVTVVPANHWAVNLKEAKLYYDENSLKRYTEVHVLGFMLHEIGHMKNTGDINTDTEIFTKHPSVSKQYINAVEDVRIDAIMSRKYAGSMEVIDALRQQGSSYALDMLDSYKDKQAKIEIEKKRAKTDARNTDLPTSIQNQALNAHSKLVDFEKTTDVEMMMFAAMTVFYSTLDPLTEARVLDAIKPEQRQAVHALAETVDRSGMEFADSTFEVQNFYENELFPIIKEFLPPEESQQSQSKHGSDGQSGKGEQNLNDMNQQGAKGPDASSEDPTNGGETEDQEDSDTGEMRPGKRLAQAGGDRQAKDVTRAQRVQRALPDQDPNSEAFASSVGKGDGGSQADYAGARAQVRGNVANMSARMNRVLRDNSFSRYQGRNRSGRLRKSGLYRFMTNDTRLFQRKTALQNKSYAFSVLIDASGSMQGHMWDEALKAVALLTDTCKKLNIPIEITAFSSRHVKAKPFHQPIHPEIFDDTVSPVLFGGTTLHPAFKDALQSLAAQPENQRFVITLTDGELDESDKRHIPELMRKYSSFKFYGIGIGVDLKRYFPNSTNVKDASEIPPAFAKIIKANIKR